MIKLDDTSKKLLDKIQKDLPLCPNPYAEIAKECGLSEQKTIDKLKYLIDNNIIREISVLLNADKLGYHSTLVAAKVNKENLEKVVKIINSHSGVTHNYLRNYEYNVWFTLTIKKGKEFSNELATMFSEVSVDKYIILPSIKTFKIEVNFSFLNYKNEVQKRNFKFKKKELGALDKQILNALQSNLELIENPWEQLIKTLNIMPDKLFKTISELKDAGVIKRISGVLQHRNAGYKANGMVCFNISEENIESAGKKASEFTEVSHCYQRPTYPDWQYSLFCMVHSVSKAKCDGIIKNISKKIKCIDYIVLYSEKEFKKERTKYILE